MRIDLRTHSFFINIVQFVPEIVRFSCLHFYNRHSCSSQRLLCETTSGRLLLEQRSGYLETALASGFYDQAHFIHECRDFTGRSPGELLTRENFLSHFYNPRLTG